MVDRRRGSARPARRARSTSTGSTVRARCPHAGRRRRPGSTTQPLADVERRRRPSVPVTTVPLPSAANTRSTQSRGRPRSAAAPASTTSSSSAARSSSSPCAGHGRHGDHRHAVEERPRDVLGHVERREFAAARRRRGRPSSRRSPRGRRRAARGCAGAPPICGFHPSVAATTNTQRRPRRRRRACWAGTARAPGTSTKLSAAPDGSVVWANPRSIVRPRRFSSASRSGSVPVSASTSDDLPWSTWPAVATTVIVRRAERSASAASDRDDDVVVGGSTARRSSNVARRPTGRSRGGSGPAARDVSPSTASPYDGIVDARAPIPAPGHRLASAHA